MRCVRFFLPPTIVICTLLALTCTARAADGQWPAWRGPNRDGKSPDKGLLKSWPTDGPKLLWKINAIGQGFSSVSFGGGLIYITGRKEAGNPQALPEAKHVYERAGKRKYITAIDIDGKVKWVKDVTEAYLGYYKGARATVTYDNGNLYLLTGTGEIGCYDAANGDAKWKHGYVFWAVGYGRGGICMKLSVAGEKVTAAEAWRTEDMDCMVGGYIIHDGYIYGNHKLGYTCLDLKTGEKKWFERAVGKGSLCWADDMLYLYNEKDGTAGLATCSPGGLEMKGTFRVDGENQSWAHPVVFGGRLYLRYDDTFYCFDVADRTSVRNGSPGR
ncbi:MAG: PQQ-binding-like beta-propeller repeat protein [Candidatus Nealsonbacteria bacterium]|nr:PQQ-binding-like beta-propeller repeat protein [Candidatus Nealsonbacteria bacterium]